MPTLAWLHRCLQELLDWSAQVKFGQRALYFSMMKLIAFPCPWLSLWGQVSCTIPTLNSALTMPWGGLWNLKRQWVVCKSGFLWWGQNCKCLPLFVCWTLGPLAFTPPIGISLCPKEECQAVLWVHRLLGRAVGGSFSSSSEGPQTQPLLSHSCPQCPWD